MNHDNERKAFDKWVLTHPDNLDLTNYEENIMFDAWLASANREGYKLVPIEPTDVKLKEFQKIWLDSGCAHIMKKRVALDLYKAMIGVCDDN